MQLLFMTPIMPPRFLCFYSPEKKEMDMWQQTIISEQIHSRTMTSSRPQQPQWIPVQSVIHEN